MRKCDNAKNVKGISYISGYWITMHNHNRFYAHGEHLEKIPDITEGLAAFLTLPFSYHPGDINFDNGGGKYDYATHYLYDTYKIVNLIYDPYQRSAIHNKKVLTKLKITPATTTTSIGVLNVIDGIDNRRSHIQLSKHYLKPGGYAFFKIYEGDGTKHPSKSNTWHQNNRPTIDYINEIRSFFGRENVIHAEDGFGTSSNTIIARKPIQ